MELLTIAFKMPKAFSKAKNKAIADDIEENNTFITLEYAEIVYGTPHDTIILAPWDAGLLLDHTSIEEIAVFAEAYHAETFALTFGK